MGLQRSSFFLKHNASGEKTSIEYPSLKRAYRKLIHG